MDDYWIPLNLDPSLSTDIPYPRDRDTSKESHEGPEQSLNPGDVTVPEPVEFSPREHLEVGPFSGPDHSRQDTRCDRTSIDTTSGPFPTLTAEAQELAAHLTSNIDPFEVSVEPQAIQNVPSTTFLSGTRGNDTSKRSPIFPEDFGYTAQDRENARQIFGDKAYHWKGQFDMPGHKVPAHEALVDQDNTLESIISRETLRSSSEPVHIPHAAAVQQSHSLGPRRFRALATDEMISNPASRLAGRTDKLFKKLPASFNGSSNLSSGILSSRKGLLPGKKLPFDSVSAPRSGRSLLRKHPFHGISSTFGNSLPLESQDFGEAIISRQRVNELRTRESSVDSCNSVDDGAGKEARETKAEFCSRLMYVLKQMMFVSGETAEPSPETTWMIEEIVREQVVEMLKEATSLANRRGSKSISIVDLIFQIRHNVAKVSRLKTFLSWKDVRKNVKDSDDKAGGADADALDLEDGALPGSNPSAPQKTSANKKAKLVLPWEVQSFYNETVPEREDEEDEEEEEQNEATLARLASADERTKNMTREEYVYWSECRQASFTFRKGKRFREWAGFGTIIDSKPNDDIVDILGFLTFEIVQTITEEALKVKAAEDLANKKANGLRGDNENGKKRKREGCTLFEMPEEGRTPVEPRHVREAFRRLQIVPNKYKFMRPGFSGIRTPLRMI